MIRPARQHPRQLRDVRGQVDDDDATQRKNDRWCSRPQGTLPGPSTTSMIPLARTATVVKIGTPRPGTPAPAAMSHSGSAFIPRVIVHHRVIPTGRTSRGKERTITYGNYALAFSE